MKNLTTIALRVAGTVLILAAVASLAKERA